MNITPISNVNYNVNYGINTQQNKVTNPFMMQNNVDTFELTTAKKELPVATDLSETFTQGLNCDAAKAKLKEGFANAGEKFKSHISQGIDTVAEEAENFNKPSEAMTTSHVAANTAFIGQALIGAGSAVVEIAKGIVEAFKALA